MAKVSLIFDIAGTIEVEVPGITGWVQDDVIRRRLDMDVITKKIAEYVLTEENIIDLEDLQINHIER